MVFLKGWFKMLEHEITVRYENLEGETTKIVGLIIRLLTTVFDSVAMSSKLQEHLSNNLLESTIITNAKKKDLKTFEKIMESLLDYDVIKYEYLCVFPVSHPQE